MDDFITYKHSNENGIKVIGIVVKGNVDFLHFYLPDGRKIVFSEIEFEKVIPYGVSFKTQNRQFALIYKENAALINADSLQEIQIAGAVFCRAFMSPKVTVS
jgi:hypothetical protein